MHVRTLNRPRREGNDDTPRTSLQTSPKAVALTMRSSPLRAGYGAAVSS